jgi:tetratricopeptide (TPR) repeat protein
MTDERFTSSQPFSFNSTGNAEWYVIHGGTELGPLTLAELVEKAAAREIEPDDLVKQTGGLWTPARDIGLLQQQFLLKESKNKATGGASDEGGIVKPLHGLLFVLAALAAVWVVGMFVSKSSAPSQPPTALNDADSSFNRGNASMKKRDYDQAIRHFDEAIRSDPKNVRAFLGRGNAWLDKQEFDRAIKDFDEAIRLDPAGDFFFFRGFAWFKKKAYDQAIRDYDQAIRLDPNDAWAFLGRGDAWFAKRDYDQAILDYDEAIRLDPNNALAHRCRSAAWSEKKEEERRAADRLAGIPDVRLFMKSNGSRFIRGTVHNETGWTVERLKLSIRTARWERVYEIRINVPNNTTRSFSVYVGEAVDVESFRVLAE